MKKRPNLIHLSWFFKHVFYQRTRFIKREVIDCLKDFQVDENLNDTKIDVLDIGCGDGQFAFFAKNKFKNIRVFCNDTSIENIEFCKLYQQKFGLQNVVCSTELDSSALDGVEIVFAFSVLQYVENDVAFLQQLNSKVSTNGKLLLYIPINHRKIGWLYMILFHSFETYESSHNRKKVYSMIQVESVLKQGGFKIKSAKFACGKNGIRAQEWLSNAVTLISQSNYIYKTLGCLYGILASLPILIYQFADKFNPKNELTSNAVMIECVRLDA